MKGLRFLIDTAATCSVLDKKLTKALKLEPEPGEFQIAAFGKITKARCFRIPMLRIGPIFATVHFLAADLSEHAVDGILGLDLLRFRGRLASCETAEVIQYPGITIDFEERKLQFGTRRQFEHTAPLEVINSQVAVSTRIQGRVFHLAVDTGIDNITLFKNSGLDSPTLTIQRHTNMMPGAVCPAKEVLLRDIEISACRWRNLNALILNLPGQATDGVLAIAPLGFKILHLDFARNLMSWRK